MKNYYDSVPAKGQMYKGRTAYSQAPDIPGAPECDGHQMAVFVGTPADDKAQSLILSFINGRHQITLNLGTGELAALLDAIDDAKRRMAQKELKDAPSQAVH